ncbi:hypothetical protein [Chondromyces crocatus]|uniref:hypothetical protein n=1 Tax=Chondromyces crocatus TaxID=52 RepID=UPI00067D821F|nr:hypothetical protein [Chondromyces crocatus]
MSRSSTRRAVELLRVAACWVLVGEDVQEQALQERFQGARVAGQQGGHQGVDVAPIRQAAPEPALEEVLVGEADLEVGDGQGGVEAALFVALGWLA